MQADDDVGKIALAVPVLVSKALELFLQDLCDRTYEITLQRGAKTVSSLHLRVADDDDASDKENKKSRIHEASHSSGRGRGRGCGRGHGRPRTVDRDNIQPDKFEDDPDISLEHQEKPDQNSMGQDGGSELKESKLSLAASSSDAAMRNFDLNAEVDNSADKAEAAVKPAAEPEANHEEYPGWSDNMTIDPVQLAQLNRRVDEDEEDYDEEG